MKVRHYLPVVVPLLILALLAGGCAPKQAAREAGPASGGALSASAPAPPSAPGESADKSAAGGAGQGAPEAKPADRKIITTGSMEIEVTNLDEAVARLTTLLRQHGGFFASKNVSRQESWRTAELVLRIPAAKFDALHDGAVALGDVRRDEQTGEDVTKQWQDLEARLKVRKAKEQTLVGLLKRQAKLSDLMAVEKELWAIREEIEVAEGELRYLRDQVTLATLTVTIREQIPVSVGPLGEWNLGYHFTNAFQTLGRWLRGLLTGLIYVLIPGAVIWVPLLLIIRAIRRRLRARAEKRAAPPPPPAASA